MSSFKRLFCLLMLLALLPLCAQAEIILFEDENGKVIMGDDGEIDFLPPDGSFASPEASPGEETPAPLPTPIPYAVQEERLIEAYSLDTPLPSPTPQPFAYTRKLEYGSNGALVERLQDRLRELGFYDAKSSGGYYEITQRAVRTFQTHNGLSADGVAGRQTQELLFSSNAAPAWATPRPSPTPVPAKYTLMVDVTNQIVRAYTYDASGSYTVLVREMICSTGTSKNPTPLGTTIMPKKRARWGYFPTWDSHAQYLTRIDSANAFHSVLYSAADERTLSVKSFEDLGTPASHGCVRLYVSDAKWIYDNCEAGTIITVYEGEYDPEYTMTLRRSLNTQTLRERSLPQPTPTPAYSRENWPAEYRTLYRGRSGEDVFMLQMRLSELGYYNGTITGGYYGGTIKAVEAFQRDHGLAVDGAAGEKTQSLLFSSSVDPVPMNTQAAAQTPAPVPTNAPTPVPTATPVPEPTPLPAAVPMVVPEYVPRAPVEDSVG
ncbi:MAG: peptidoglycan-binding protein [Clostridia bacterium]|nr:peptidoglycan-binding protein [Clostridia bacterium]